MSSKNKTLHDLFQHQIKDLYYAERHAGKILVKMAKAVSSEPLRQALEARHDETSANVDRLETIFESLDKKAQGVPCEAMQGIIEETKTLLDDFDGSPVLDAGIVGAAMAIEHYAIARYSSLKLWAAQLGLDAARAPIDRNLSEAQGALDRWLALAGTTSRMEPHSPPAQLTLKDAALMGLR